MLATEPDHRFAAGLSFTAMMSKMLPSDDSTRPFVKQKATDPSGFDAAAAALIGSMRSTREDRWSDTDFEQWALRAFSHQFMECSVYRAWCTSRGVTPGTIARWQDAPAVPATAFKYLDFRAPDERLAEVEFRTSGTTEGAGRRGVHRVLSLDLYRASLLGPLKDALLPDADGMCMVSLVPRPSVAPHSSLSFMVGEAAEQLSTGTHWLVDADGSWNADEVERFRRRDLRAPVLLLGTALAFLHAVENRAGDLASLAPGSRIMETGGFKGVRRTVSREELYASITEYTGVPGERIVNEYGMTELLSQLWEPVLREGAAAMGSHLPAPWLRVRALDPNTLAALPEGEEGVLAFFDLANLGSVSHILTQDIGSVRDGRVRLRGRAADAEPRGCSRAMDDLMTVVESHHD